MAAPSCFASSSRPLLALLAGPSCPTVASSTATLRRAPGALSYISPPRHISTSRRRLSPPHRPTRPVSDAEPAIVKSPSSPDNPASWPGLQKKAATPRDASADGTASPFASLASGLTSQAHEPAPRAESSRAALEREQGKESSKVEASRSTPLGKDDASAACATLSPSSPAAPRSQNNGKAREINHPIETPKAVAPETRPPAPSAGPAKTARPAKAFRAKKAALNLTPTAVERLRDLLESDSGPRLIRIGVRNKGCAGMSYHLEYVTPDQAGKFDERVQQDGVEVLIDSKALFSIIGSVMDWQEDRLSAKFVFNNPNVTSECGCGESFMT